VEGLATLKAQLQQALAQVEQAEKTAADAAKPQTLQEVDELEKKLTDALSELKARREELKKK
jgi:sialic acid synthase SpsE